MAIKAHLEALGRPVLDVGTHNAESCDYPVFAIAAAEAVAKGTAWRGVIVDGAGIGSSMVANKIHGVRAALAFNLKTATNAREHNDANVLTLGAGYLQEREALDIVDVFLSTVCTVDRHQRRVSMIDALDAARPQLRSASEMSVDPGQQRLIEAIERALKANPTLLSGIAGVGGSCSTSAHGCSGGDNHGASLHANCANLDPPAVRSVLQGCTDGRVSASLGVGAVPADLAPIIDHTLLKPGTTYAEIEQLCDEAAICGFASVCVNPIHVARAAKHLAGKSPKVCTVIGFPLGATPKENKVLEARRAIRDGADELDMVIAIGALRSGDYDYVYQDIRGLVEVANERGRMLKVIIETALLTDEEKVMACMLAKRARAHFVKTSTGFASGGATREDVALMARAVDYSLEVKASGGVRSAEDAHGMVQAGATRIGASVGVKIAGCNVQSGRQATAY